jgi:hypothetical protein
MKTLQAALETLGMMAERDPSLVSDPAWQNAAEGLGVLVKREDIRRIITSFQNAPAPRYRNTQMARLYRTFNHV